MPHQLHSSLFVVDNFGIKFIGKDHVMHLIKTLKEHYDNEDGIKRQGVSGNHYGLGLHKWRGTSIHA